MTHFTVRKHKPMVVSWLVCLTPDWTVQVLALAREIALYSWTRDFILAVTLSAQVYKWAPANLELGKPCDGAL